MKNLPDDPDDVTAEDLLSEFESLWESVNETQEKIPDESAEIDFEPDEFIDTVDERAREVAHDTALDGIGHLVDEECGNDRCNQIRDALGLTDSHESGNENSGGGSEDVSSDTNSESSDDEGDGGSAESGDTGGTDGSGDDASDSSDDMPWGDDTNIFGESV